MCTVITIRLSTAAENGRLRWSRSDDGRAIKGFKISASLKHVFMVRFKKKLPILMLRSIIPYSYCKPCLFSHYGQLQFIASSGEASTSTVRWWSFKAILIRIGTLTVSLFYENLSLLPLSDPEFSSRARLADVCVGEYQPAGFNLILTNNQR